MDEKHEKTKQKIMNGIKLHLEGIIEESKDLLKKSGDVKEVKEVVELRLNDGKNYVDILRKRYGDNEVFEKYYLDCGFLGFLQWIFISSTSRCFHRNQISFIHRDCDL